MDTEDGRGRWVGYGTGPGGRDQLPPDLRAEAGRREAARRERQGQLLCEVLVRVYEHEAAPEVDFPAGSALGVQSDPGAIATAVARARDALAGWR